MDPVFQRRHGHHLRHGVEQLQPGSAGRRLSESRARVSGTVQQYMEQQVGGWLTDALVAALAGTLEMNCASRCSARWGS